MSKEAIEALEAARAHILDAYRIWQADDVSAVPPPKSGAGSVIAKIDAVLSTLPIAVEGKEGWKLVPRQPTVEMDSAGYDTVPSDMTIKTGVDHQDIWKAMFDAAPSSPGGQEAEAVGDEAALLARVASIICEETCGLTSQCKSREAAKALFDKGYLRTPEASPALQTAIYRLCVIEDSPNLIEAERSLIRGWISEARSASQPTSTALVEAARHLLEVGEFCRTDDTEKALRNLRIALHEDNRS